MVRAGKVVGIITRANLVQAVAANGAGDRNEQLKSDEEIRQALVAGLERQPWWHPGWATVSVTEGVVQFRWRYRHPIDSRDRATGERLDDLNDPYRLFRCRTTMNCIEVCPKGLAPSRAIEKIRLMMVEHSL